jgi:hypothetical protein
MQEVYIIPRTRLVTGSDVSTAIRFRSVRTGDGERVKALLTCAAAWLDHMLGVAG